ncbi:MAG: macro domain-containing protein [Gallicola sp.]|nr:macro domain-containing protein [Gallicola sp.]
MPFQILRQDITQMTVDAIVNAANTELLMGGGVCGAIFKAAGEKELQHACTPLAPISTGNAVITPGFNLKANYVIHTVGPEYKDGQHGESKELANAYLNALKIASDNDCSSIAFPLISSGIYGYPKEEALKVARKSIQAYLDTNDLDVYLCVFDKASFAVSQKLMGEIEAYIDQNYVDENHIRRDEYEESLSEIYAFPTHTIDEVLTNLDEPFNRTLFRLIDKKGLDDVDVYKKANLDRKLFSKIRSSETYTPSKRTILALAIALKLSLDETDTLLSKAGYALSHSHKFDVIVEYFIENQIFDIFQINEVLFQYDQVLLGS